MKIDNSNCKYFEKCSIFKELLKDNRILTETYKKIYCENGKEGKLSCKRFLVYNEVGECSANLLPNSKRTIEEIVGISTYIK